MKPAVYSVVIFALAILLGSGIVAGMHKSDILSVRAGESAGVSDTDSPTASGGIVSPVDDRGQIVFTGGAEPLKAFADPELASFPFTMTHLLQMDDGTVTSTVPASSSLTDGSIYNLSSGSQTNVTSVPRTDETTSGNLYQGLDMGMSFNGGLSNIAYSDVKSFVGEVVLHLSDSSQYTWACGNAINVFKNNVYNHTFVFNWSDVQTVLDERSATVVSADVNVIYGFKDIGSFEIIRHDADADIRLASVHPDLAIDRIFTKEVYSRNSNLSTDRSINLADMKSGTAEMPFSGSAATLTGGMIIGQKCYLYVNDAGHTIKSVTAKAGSSDVTSANVSYDSANDR